MSPPRLALPPAVPHRSGVLAGPPANADEQTLETLVHAFLDDPLFAFIFPRAERRERDLRRLFAGSLRHAGRVGGVSTVEAGLGAAVWTPRASMHVSIGAAWRAAMLALPLQLGLPAMRRLDMYELELDRVTRDAAGGDFAYLWMLAAHPRAQGRGLGRAAVEHALGQMRAAGFAQCLLRTQQPRNVSFYRHLGFREVLRHTPAWVDLETIVFARDL